MTRSPVLTQRQRGLTLVELVAVIVILSVSLAGVVAGISAGISRSADTLLQTRAVALAQSYLDEILARRFDDAAGPRGVPPCASTGIVCSADGALGAEGAEGSDRTVFNDVDDYNGLDEGFSRPDPLRDAEGNPRQGYDNFRVQVAVRYLQPGVGEPEANLVTTAAAGYVLNPQDAKLITVTVSHPSQAEGWQFSVYKANF